MHPLRPDGEVMWHRLDRATRFVVSRKRSGALARRHHRSLVTGLRQRILRPAAVPYGRDRCRATPRFLLPELARRQAEAGAEGAAEMRGVGKAVTVGDLRDRMMGFRRIGEIGPGALPAPPAGIMGE